MKPINIVDARMGRGKSSAAIRYMNRFKGKRRFLYITPYLKEVDRICEQCDFEQPDSDFASKSTELKGHLYAGHNVAATHSLFYLLDDVALELIRDRNYSLIGDEAINTIGRLNVTEKDFQLIVEQLADVGDNGKLRWRDPDYCGKFTGYKEAVDTGSVHLLDNALLNILNPEILRSFDEVFMLTYLFDGQYQKAYLECFGFEYRVIGVIQDDGGFRFSDRPDNPPPIDYSGLIHIVGTPKMNAPGDPYYALSRNWYLTHRYESPDMRSLRNGMKNFFLNMTQGGSDERLWTCFKEGCGKLLDKNGRFRSNYLQISARATNEYRGRTDLAYMVNRFADPNLKKFFANRGCVIDEERFALSEMLQWIWRGAIRDDRPINLYIPSSRMRKLLTDWIGQASEGGGRS